ncbi:MAG: cytochrome c [Proteobacteria bacterium]|nr:cytochrome c [Pseudomonadota bacterium]
MSSSPRRCAPARGSAPILAVILAATVVVGAAVLVPAAHAAAPGSYGIGTTPTEAEIAGWSIAVPPSGANLPPGHGSVSQGSDLFGTVCAVCHGAFGEGVADYPRLAGGVGSLATVAPAETVGSYWPYATTLFDFINRAMPFYAPHSLTPDQVYALTAFILNLNGIVPDGFVADAQTVPAVKMPNRDGFIWKDPRPLTHDTECMTKCVDPASLRITSTAKGDHLTPRTTGPVDDMKAKHP